MVDKITFMETLRSVQELAKASPEPMSKEEIRSYFQDMELSEKQQEMIYQYLLTPPEEPKEEQEVSGENNEPELSEESGMQNRQSDKEEETKEKETEGRKRVSTHFQMYLEEISGVPSLTPKQEQTLYEQLLTGEQTAIGEISGQWLKRVIELAETYVTEQVLLEDLVQEGNIGLLTGLGQLLGKASEYGMTDKAPLSEVQKQKLKQRLETFVKEGMESYRQEMEGETNSENTILAKVSLVHEARKILAEENGTVPTLQELCEYTKISPEEISDILALQEKADKK